MNLNRHSASARRLSWGGRTVRARRVVAALGVAIALVTAAACSSESADTRQTERAKVRGAVADLASDQSFSSETEAAAAEALAGRSVAAPAASADGSVTGIGAFPADRKIIATADVSIRTKNVSTAAATLRASVTTAGGYVENEQAVTTPSAFDEEGNPVGGPAKTSSVTMRIRVPTARFDGLLKRLDTLGVTTTRAVGAQDVTSEVVDVDSRVISAKASIARMQVLYEKAVSIADIAAIEGELSRRQADLESLLARQKQLADQTAMATIGVTLFDDSLPQPKAPRTGVAKAFDDALETFGDALRNILVAVAGVLPFLILGLVIGFPLYRTVRRRSTQREAKHIDLTVAAPPAPTASTAPPAPPFDAE